MRRAASWTGLAVLGFCLGGAACFLATPLLWKLERPTGLELAGHSGPAAWVLALFGTGGAVGLSALGWSALKLRGAKSRR